ncbi:MAG: redoxin domain-containing protein [Phycisphaerales bacterium]
MKRILGVVCLAAAVALPVLLASREAQDTAPSKTNIDVARDLLNEVAATYRNAPAMTDTMTVTSGAGTQITTVQLVAGSGGNAQLTGFGHNFVAIDGHVYIWPESRPGKFVSRPLSGGQLTTLDPVSPFRPPQLVLRYGQTIQDYIAAFGMGLFQDVQLTGYEKLEQDGAEFAALKLRAGAATISVLIDPGSKLIKSLNVEGPRGDLKFRMSPEVHARPPRKITFDPTGRREVRTLAQLGLGEGDVAPDFTLSTLDDQEVTLSDLRGSAVVLDFWATWCPPCRRGLPKLQEFATWAEQEGVAVKVFTVDMGERVRTNEQKRRKVQQFWQRQGFTMPTLMDYDDKVAQAFEVGSIPHTVVIGPDGKLWKVHIGFNPGMVEVLKQETAQALAEAD